MVATVPSVKRARVFRATFCAQICLALLAGFATKPYAQNVAPPAISVSGGILGLDGSVNNDGSLGGGTYQFLFSWSSHLNEGLSILGTSWPSNANIEIHLNGPLNLPGVTPTDFKIATVTPNSNGAFTLSGLLIPWLVPNVNPGKAIRPGNYEVYATKPSPFPNLIPPIIATAVDHINICPMTLPPFKSFIPGSFGNWMGIPWYLNRGARTGPLGDTSPEMTDPEWLSVWSDQPVALYGTVAPSNSNGGNQPVHVAFHEVPWTHYGHDLNIDLVPDKEYMWVLGNANMISFDELVQLGRIEWEWETQNGGSPFSYGYTPGQINNIGMPLWASPTVGDRIFTVGRWVMDNGHPEEGLRTEIHPARMIATMRKRGTAVPIAPAGVNVLTRASQVDVYVSGHGGGSNQYPDALGEALDDGGRGGGMIGDALSNGPRGVYFSQGPADIPLVNLLSGVINRITDVLGLPSPPDFSQVQGAAGPSGLGWGNGPELRPVNDMDYDFDVPLPTPPTGATNIQVRVNKHPEDTTGVNEQITYTSPDANGLPTTAHFHLPYKGADNGVFGRTFNFYWDKFSPPGNHFQVQFDHLIFTMPTFQTLGTPFVSGRDYVWAEICGQWAFLTGFSPTDFLLASPNKYAQVTNMPPFDVFLDQGDKLRVFSQGYDQEPFDQLYGSSVGKSAYSAGFDMVETIASAWANMLFASWPETEQVPGDDVDLGGALFEQQFKPGSTTTAQYSATANTGYFSEYFNVSYVPRPPVLGVGGVPVSFGTVCMDAPIPGAARDVTVTNQGEAPLTVTSVTVSGGGYSVVPGLPVPFTVSSGQLVDLNVYFKPFNVADGVGTLTIQSNDPLQPSVTYSLSGTAGFPRIRATANTGNTPIMVIGATTKWPVALSNTGTCSLRIHPSITGTGFSLILPKNILGQPMDPIVIAPGSSVSGLTVVFMCTSVTTKAVGTLSLGSNDPVTPTSTLVFGAEGVPVGMRVLVVDADGTPYPSVDDIKLKNVNNNINTHLKDVPLTTIDPPDSWKRIQYHYMTALPPTADWDTYELRVQVGNKKQIVNFSLAVDEFKQLVITLP